MSGYIPSIGIRGVFTLLTPFETRLLPQVSYSCIAVRRLADIVAAGGDPKAEYYTPNGLSDEQYNQDLVSSACIITLQAGSASVEYIPSSYISGFPEIGGIPYTGLLLAMNIGAVPDSLDLSYVKQRLAELVLENLGIATTAEAVVASLPSILSPAEHQALVATREQAMGTITTDYSRFLEAQNSLIAAQSKIAELEAFIIGLNLPDTP